MRCEKYENDLQNCVQMKKENAEKIYFSAQMQPAEIVTPGEV